ncbi:DUF2283 domain-containing protein [bacterium]|nr:DUF2283 domain-containing protein [bacterium]MBU1614496.1 DUF2283 domain-containing protein [bacterium]
MEKVTVTYDKVGNTLDVWFRTPCEAICEEIGGGVVIKKNKKGEVIGFEKLNYFSPAKANKEGIFSLPVEVVIA